MRYAIATAVAVLGVLIAPTRSFAQTSLDGFGALSIGHLASIGDSGIPVDFGGRVSFDAVPAVQVFGEFGRIGNVMPIAARDWAVIYAVRCDCLRVLRRGWRAACWLRLGRRSARTWRAPPASRIYGSVREGLARRADAIVRAAMNLVDTRDPLFGVGGGILMRAGPLQVDLGYRFKRILRTAR